MIKMLEKWYFRHKKAILTRLSWQNKNGFYQV